MEKQKIERINFLAAKQKSPEGLTDLEKEEQRLLREEYLAEYRLALRAQLESTVIRRPDGTEEKLKRR